MHIPISKPYFSAESIYSIQKNIGSILDSGQLMMGKWTRRFEKEFSEFVGVKHAIAVNTCTTALQIVLQYSNVKEGEVLVPSGSFITNISSIKWSGGTPVFVDMNPNTLSFDLEDLERKRTVRTKAIMWVHLTGIISSEYQMIVEYAKDHNLVLIEDCAHSLGASVNGINAGSLANAGCFSFFPSKIMTTGTGGMITTNDTGLMEYAKQARLLGRCLDDSGEICIEGNDWFMDEIRACIGSHQMKDLNFNLMARRSVANRYNTAFQNHSKMDIFEFLGNNNPSYYQYVVILDNLVNRDNVIKILKEEYGVASKRVYLPTHKESIFKDLNFDSTTLKQTENTLNQSLCLPIYCSIDDKEVEHVISSVLAILTRYDD
jgi:dTDP-4-amino-4,6-dideoxygalactose transaminase